MAETIGRGGAMVAALLSGLISAALSGQDQGRPDIVLEDRESVTQVKKIGPFFGRWTRIEYPPGTPIEVPDGGCYFRESNHGMSVQAGCGPWDEPAEATNIFWHPIEQKFVFQLYSVLYPTDLLFQGVYEFPTAGSVRRTYKGFYGDGRIHLYRETWTLLSADRLRQETERFSDGAWQQIFEISIYERSGSEGDRTGHRPL